MPLIPVTVKLFTAFSNSQVKVITTGFSYIKKVSSAFSCTDALAVNAFHFFVVVFVRHWYIILNINELPVLSGRAKIKLFSNPQNISGFIWGLKCCPWPNSPCPVPAAWCTSPYTIHSFPAVAGGYPFPRSCRCRVQ
jgi:hypothetical protein